MLALLSLRWAQEAIRVRGAEPEVLALLSPSQPYRSAALSDSPAVDSTSPALTSRSPAEALAQSVPLLSPRLATDGARLSSRDAPATTRRAVPPLAAVSQSPRSQPSGTGKPVDSSRRVAAAPLPRHAPNGLEEPSLFSSYTPSADGIHFTASIREVDKPPELNESGPAERSFIVSSVEPLPGGGGTFAGVGRSGSLGSSAVTRGVLVRALGPTTESSQPRWHRHSTLQPVG